MTRLDSYYSLLAKNIAESNEAEILDKYNGAQYKECVIGGKHLLLRSNASLTPYIDEGCSARCLFCSERLSKNGCIDIEEAENSFVDYTVRVQKFGEIIRSLDGFNLSLSISGLEPLLDLKYIEALINEVRNAEIEGFSMIGSVVMYTNLSHCSKFFSDIQRIIQSYPRFERIEISRHHYNDQINDSIMKYQDRSAVSNQGFAERVSLLQPIIPIKLVCVMQKDGIDSLEEVKKYLDWALSMNFKMAGFRQLAIVDPVVDNNVVSEYCNTHRVDMSIILESINQDSEFTFDSVTKGYYFYTFRFWYKGILSSFGISDYEEMINHHHSECKDKLILYPNGSLCYDWDISKVIF